jgi:hypothetical protein
MLVLSSSCLHSPPDQHLDLGDAGHCRLASDQLEPAQGVGPGGPPLRVSQTLSVSYLVQ